GGADQEVRLASAPEGHLFLQRTSQGIEVRGDIRAAIALPCARCLKECIVPIVSEFKEYFILQRYAPAEQDKELVHDDLDISFLPEEGIELRDIVEEQIWLNIPMKPLCHDGCKGLCTVCGADLNSGECGCDRHVGDPRFAVLKSLKSNLT
ncbi:MAG TPA: DUF177 domain-containing protein, partial [Thermodesulfobacteriota bacterium]